MITLIAGRSARTPELTRPTTIPVIAVLDRMTSSHRRRSLPRPIVEMALPTLDESTVKTSR